MARHLSSTNRVAQQQPHISSHTDTYGTGTAVNFMARHLSSTNATTHQLPHRHIRYRHSCQFHGTTLVVHKSSCSAATTHQSISWHPHRHIRHRHSSQLHGTTHFVAQISPRTDTYGTSRTDTYGTGTAINFMARHTLSSSSHQHFPHHSTATETFARQFGTLTLETAVSPCAGTCGTQAQLLIPLTGEAHHQERPVFLVEPGRGPTPKSLGTLA